GLARLLAKDHHRSSENFAQGHANIPRSRLSRGERKLVRQEGTFMSSFGQVRLDRLVRLHDATLLFSVPAMLFRAAFSVYLDSQV
ncbi:hypothetical protein NPIL_479271, partial [Nephila pilipes]